MVLKRLFTLIFSTICLSYVISAHPFIDGIEGFKVSPVSIKTSIDYYLINESCNVCGIKMHSGYQFCFAEENSLVNASIFFLGSGATGSMNEEFPIPKDLIIKIDDKEVHYDIFYEGNLIKSISEEPFDKRIPGIVNFSFESKKNTKIDIFYSNDPILLNYESEILYTFYTENINDNTKYVFSINNEDFRKINCLFDERIKRLPKENIFEVIYSPTDFITNTNKEFQKKFHIKIQILSFGFDEESKFYYLKYTNNRLSKQDIFFLSNKQLRLLRNMFYAVHGYSFKDKRIHSFFQNNLPTEYIINPEFSENCFSAVENENIKIIRELENMKEPILLSEYLK